VEFVHPQDAVQMAAKKMERNNVGIMPVLDDRQHAVGVITDRDITIRVVAENLSADMTPVRDVMTPNVLFCKEDDHIAAAAEMMKKNQVRRLLVKNEEENFTGVLSLGDIAVDAGASLSGEVLEEVSKPPMP
jgi:CBS domain-containing protein